MRRPQAGAPIRAPVQVSRLLCSFSVSLLLCVEACLRYLLSDLRDLCV